MRCGVFANTHETLFCSMLTPPQNFCGLYQLFVRAFSVAELSKFSPFHGLHPAPQTLFSVVERVVTRIHVSIYVPPTSPSA